MIQECQDSQITGILKKYEHTLHNFDSRHFEKIALELFNLQAENNVVYNQYITHLGINPKTIKQLKKIPFLPITLFRNRRIVSGCWKEEKTFLSSTTTNTIPSQHHIKDMAFYHTMASHTFNMFYGDLTQFHLLALLPSYREKASSSLASMVNHFIGESKSNQSGFYLGNPENLYKKLYELQKSEKKTILWGVSFALMELAENQQTDLSHCIVMETGGMKGKREEITRAEMHAFLCHRFNVKNIHSEYGMTELLSQAYAQRAGLFRPPGWMKIMIRDLKDPFSWCETGKLGGINIIDLANIHTCAFIETQDIGKQHQDNCFEVLGRADNTTARGCSLLTV